MNIADALNRTAERHQLSDAEIAVAAGVSSSAVCRWRSGKNEPRGAQLMALRKKYRLFADLLDGKVAAA